MKNSSSNPKPAQDKARDEMVERTLQFAELVTRELLPLAPKKWLMLDVTTAQLKLMFVLFLRGRLRMSVLAKALGVSLPTITTTVDRLVKRGILVREEDPNDRRGVYCRLSEQGQMILNQLWNEARERTGRMLAALTIDELEIVNHALEMLLKAGQMTRSVTDTEGEK